MKTITLTDIVVKEIQFTKTGSEYIINVLYASKDAQGNEYRQQWMVLKTDTLPSGIDTFLDGVFTRVKNKILQMEGIG